MKGFWQLLLIFALVLFFYHPIFGVYFSQDDFFHFEASRTDGSVRAFIGLLGFPSFAERGYAFWRPLFREGLYNLYYSLFGLNVLPFRLLSFFIHLLNITLVYTLMRKLFNNKYLTFFVALFFGVGSSNVALLYYLAGGIQALGATMFLLLTLICFWKYLETRSVSFQILSIATFILSLASHELAAVTPLLLCGIVAMRAKAKLWKSLVQAVHVAWPFFLILAIYLYLDIVKIGFLQTEAQYQPIFAIKTIFNSFLWYSLWAFGLPEMLIDFVQPGFRLNPNLMLYWGNYFRIIFSLFFLGATLLVAATVYLLVKNVRILKDLRFWFLFLWFPLAIFPVILLPLHKSTYYLATGLMAFWGVIGFLITHTHACIAKANVKIANIFLAVLVAVLIGLEFTSVLLGNRTYPAAVRGRIAGKLTKEIMEQYPQLPKGTLVYITNDKNYPFISREWGGTSKQASLILNGDDALRLLYRDNTLQVFYEDFGGIPNNFQKDNIYSFVAKF